MHDLRAARKLPILQIPCQCLEHTDSVTTDHGLAVLCPGAAERTRRPFTKDAACKEHDPGDRQ